MSMKTDSILETQPQRKAPIDNTETNDSKEKLSKEKWKAPIVCTVTSEEKLRASVELTEMNQTFTQQIFFST